MTLTSQIDQSDVLRPWDWPSRMKAVATIGVVRELVVLSYQVRIWYIGASDSEKEQVLFD